MEQTSFDFTRSYMMREDRLHQIFNILDRSDLPLTMLEVGRRCGLRKSPHLRGLLEELVEEGSVVYGPLRQHPSGNPAITYRSATHPF